MDEKKTEKIARVKALTMLFTAFGSGDDANRIAVYTKAFDGMPVDVLDAACRKCMYELKFLPSISEILEAAQALVEESNDRRQLEWGEALAEIEARMNDSFYQTGGKVKFSTPELEATVKAIGWRNICYCSAHEYPVVRAQLRKVYEDYCRRARAKTVNKIVFNQEKLVELEEKLRMIC